MPYRFCQLHGKWLKWCSASCAPAGKVAGAGRFRHRLCPGGKDEWREGPAGWGWSGLRGSRVMPGRGWREGVGECV